MADSSELRPLLGALNKADFNVRNLDDEIRVDQLCVDLLRHFFQELTRQDGRPPEQAGETCHGADYFLREFIVADRGENLFAVEAAHIRQFAGHWYIIRTPEPNLVELAAILNGTSAFYGYLARQGLISQATAAGIADQCRQLEYYQQRIDDFWAIEDEGYDAWRRACPLEPAKDCS